MLIKTELVELHSSLALMKQQLERAFRALDRIGREVEYRKKARTSPPTLPNVTQSISPYSRGSEGTTFGTQEGYLASHGSSKRSIESTGEPVSTPPPARKKARTSESVPIQIESTRYALLPSHSIYIAHHQQFLFLKKEPQ